ncbi:MAG: ParB/RepB/Spo0J family partition protein [Thermomicrobiales bacterium]
MTAPNRSDNPSKPKQRRGGLGRGLDALIPTTPAPQTAGVVDEATTVPSGSGAGTPLLVEIDRVRANPWQPRTQIDPQRLQELADSIRIHGVMQPLVVSGPDEHGIYTLIAGERRWRASRLAGEGTVPVIIKDAVPQAMLELALVENVVRADLSPIEEALAYRQLMDEFGLSQSAIAERVGRSRVAVTNTIRLLSAPDRVREALTGNRITEGHARALLGLPSAVDQLAALDIVLERDLTVRQAEDLVRRWGQEPAVRAKPTGGTGDEARVEEGLRSALGTRVAFRRNANGKGGTVTIQFYSDEHLHDLYSRLVGEDEW